MAGTDIGTAYVHIVPSAEGISGNIKKAIGADVDSAGESAGQSFGAKFASVAAKAIAALGVGKLIGDALNQGGQLQQSMGGIETLFKDSADKMMQYASESFRTTGLSANEYMQNVTGFSASLLQSMGGDTSKAADIANMAMTDMSDNANKMGTSMEAITTAYQGFAKQNYTMLDNLKLGYGGTKTEMERLLADAEKISGVHYDISNLSDVYEAIHVIQGELGITGTTALEASQTLEGSFNAMKAAWLDLIGQIALGGDISLALQNLTETVSTYLFGNFLPMVGNILTQIPTVIVGAIQGIANYADELINTGVELVVGLITGIITAIPQLITAAGQLVQAIWNAITSIDWISLGAEIMGSFDTGIIDDIPSIIASIGNLLNEMISAILNNLPQFLAKGGEIILQLINGIINAAPRILLSISQVLAQLISTIVSKLPQFLQQGIQAIGQFAAGLIQAIPRVVSAIPQIINRAAAVFRQFDWISIGSNIISGIVNGIVGAGSAIASTLMSLAKQAWASVKNFFGIKSPSKLMADTIGKYIPLGMAEGIEDNAKYVTDAMESMASDAVMPLNVSQLSPSPADIAPVSNSTNYGGVNINIMAEDYNSAEEIFEYIKDRLTTEAQRQNEVFA